MKTLLCSLSASLAIAPAIAEWPDKPAALLVAKRTVHVQTAQTDSSPMPLTEVIAHVKAHPEKMRVTSSFNASFNHWTTESLWQIAETPELLAPCKGAASFTMTAFLRSQMNATATRSGKTVQV